MTPDDRQRLSFGSDAALYDRARPGYPAEAVRLAVGASPCRVLDVGAGTGKLTAALVAAGHEVLAVEPDEAMLATLRSRLPQVEAHQGAAEALPLPAACVDVVVAGQALHWFDLDRALPEAARVLRPSGVLAAVWNVRDDEVPWVTQLTDLVGGSQHWSAYAGDSFRTDDQFGPVTLQVVRWQQPLDVDGLVELVASRSYALTLPAEERATLLAQVRTLGEQVVDPEGRLSMPYRTEVHRAVRLP